MTCIILCRSAERIHVSQEYRELERTRGRIRFILELRLMLLSFRIRCNIVSADDVCAFQAGKYLGFAPSSVIIDNMYVKCITISSLCLLTLTSMLMLWVLLHCHAVCSSRR